LAGRSPQSGPVPRSETLAGVLAVGPLPLAAGLRCAGEIADELRDLHERTKAYGRLTASSILMTGSGAHLLPLPDYADGAMRQRDIEAFGAVLYQVLTGTAAPATLTAVDLGVHAAPPGPSRLRTAAMKLALRCLAPKETPLSMQQVTTELRLLDLMLGQYETTTGEGRQPAPAEPAPMAHAPGGARPEPTDLGHSLPSTGETGAVPLVPLGPDSFGRPEEEAKGEPQPAGGNCPKCDSSVVYVSRARSRFERMLERWQVPICRCYRCYHRYVVVGRLKIGKNMPVGAERRLRPKHRHE
jgi:hypothetical protein